MTVNQFMNIVEHCVRAGNYYLGHCAIMAMDGKMSPVSYDIICKMNPEYRIFGIMLCMHMLRYDELNHIDWDRWAIGQAQSFIQPKTARRKSIKGAMSPLPPHRKNPSIQSCLVIMDYSRVSLAIKKATPATIQELLSPSKTETHIFRHLEASFLKKQGFPESVIAERLGHSSGEAVLSYLHERLYVAEPLNT